MTAADAVPAPRVRRYVQFARNVLASRSDDELALKLLPVLAKLGLSWPAALLIRRTFNPLTPARGRWRVLAIEKAIFNDDVLQVLGDAPDVQVIGVRRAIIKAIAVAFLPRALRSDDAYVQDQPEVEAAKRRLLAFWSALWPKLGRLDGVLTGNWCYWAEREMATALEARGTPFIVLHKEGIKPPARSAMLRDLFRRTRGTFTGRRVLVYHQAEFEHQVEGGISRPDQVRVVGMPRLDALHRWREEAAAGQVAPRAGRPTVLFAAFLTDNFLPSYSGIESDLAWTGLARGSYAALMRLAAENPDIDVIVRPRMHEADGVRALFPDGPWPANLRLLAEGNIVPLLQSAWVVSGHNTTVLLEALAMGKRVVVPHFAEALEPDYAGYIVELGDAVEHASSPDELTVRLLGYCRSPGSIERELSPAATAALAYWTGNSDGQAAKRARAVILDQIGGDRRQARSCEAARRTTIPEGNST